MSKHTLKAVQTRWPDFDLTGYRTIRSDGDQTADTSRSGAGMLLLKGIEVNLFGTWTDAHLSLPPDASGLGTFSEGHLKVEGGRFLNQYFFSCDNSATWEVEKLSNSEKVKTRDPGRWSDLPDGVWADIEKVVTYLAYL